MPSRRDIYSEYCMKMRAQCCHSGERIILGCYVDVRKKNCHFKNLLYNGNPFQFLLQKK